MKFYMFWSLYISDHISQFIFYPTPVFIVTGQTLRQPHAYFSASRGPFIVPAMLSHNSSHIFLFLIQLSAEMLTPQQISSNFLLYTKSLSIA